MVYTVRQESVNEKRDITHLEEKFQPVLDKVGVRVVAVDVMPHNPFSYALRPAEVLFVRTDMLADQKILRAISVFEPEYVVLGKDYSPNIVDELEIFVELSSKIFGDLVVYRVIQS